MSDFEPGPGWREVPYFVYRDDLLPPVRTATMRVGDQDPRYFIRDEPTSPLPTEPGYYVDAIGSAWRLGDDGDWDDTYGNPLDNERGGQPELPLVRYEPRAVVAKAVLERVLQEGLIQLAVAVNPRNGDVFDVIAREFGVES